MPISWWGVVGERKREMQASTGQGVHWRAWSQDPDSRIMTWATQAPQYNFFLPDVASRLLSRMHLRSHQSCLLIKSQLYFFSKFVYTACVISIMQTDEMWFWKESLLWKLTSLVWENFSKGNLLNFCYQVRWRQDNHQSWRKIIKIWKYFGLRLLHKSFHVFSPIKEIETENTWQCGT